MVEYWKNLITGSWTIYKNNFTLFLTYALIILGVSWVGFYLINNLTPESSFFWIYIIIQVFISFGLSLGLLKIIHDLVSGYHPTIKDITMGFYYLPKFIAIYSLIIIPALLIVLYGTTTSSPIWIILMIGIIGMLFALFFYPIIIIKHNLTISDSVRKSLDMVKANFGIVVQFILFLIIGALLFQFILAALFTLIGLGDFSALDSAPTTSLTTISIIMEFIEHLLVTPLVGIIYVKLYIKLIQTFESEIQESSS
tara:strand:+ start:149 stop:910 length:762 start_codon:yes stop_codon:yes gene_type:complete